MKLLLNQSNRIKNTKVNSTTIFLVLFLLLNTHVFSQYLNPDNFASLGTFNPGSNVTVNMTTRTMSGGSTVTGVMSGGILVFTFDSFTLASGISITFTNVTDNDDKIAFLSKGDMTISGNVYANASGSTPGPGGRRGGLGNVGSSGTPEVGLGTGGGQVNFDGGNDDGAGGGGFGGAGGKHGYNAPGGPAYGNLAAALEGGSGGARSMYDPPDGYGGGGGGALELGALGTLTLNNGCNVEAKGAAGTDARPTMCGDDGNGGGSGGGILIHGKIVTFNSGANINANGGNGGNGDDTDIGGGVLDCTASDGIATSAGGSGGSGGGGRIRFAYYTSGTNSGSASVNPGSADLAEAPAGTAGSTGVIQFVQDSNVPIPGPEISVEGNSTGIADGDSSPSSSDHTDFGSTNAAGGTVVRTFTIYNAGNVDLTISSVQISGTNSGDFSVTTSPNSPVSPAGNTTFQVTFDPSDRGNRTATITVNNNDNDEGVYDFAIQGTGSNSAPTVSGLPTDITATEDAASNVNLSAASFNDADGDALVVTLTASAGVFTASTGGGVTIGGSGTGTLSLSGTFANINTFLDTESNIKYTGESNVNGNDAATFNINANDGSVNPLLGTVNIDISAVNDDPFIVNLPSDVTVLEDLASNVNLSAATITDVDAALGAVTFALAVGAGTLSAADAGGVTVSGSGTGTLTLTGTVSNIDTYLNTASNIKYTGTLNTNGNNVTTLTLSANDGGNTGAGGGGNVSFGTANIDITAVNDEPSFTVGANQTVAQNAGARTINNFLTNINDGDAEVTQNVSINISNNNNTLFTSQPAINLSGTLTYTPDATKFGKATVTVSISDDGGTDNGGDNQSPDQTFKIFITPLGITINELNSTPTTEEFVELYNDNGSSLNMNGLVLVFFNGGDDATYKASVDLDTYTIASKDFFVMSDAGVTNSDLTWSATDIQNGPDAVALFVGDQSDFTVTPSTPATSDGLVDAIVYGSSDDAVLRTVLGGVPLNNEDANGQDVTESLSRVPDGTGSFAAQAVTPGITNDLTTKIISATYDYNNNLLVVTGNCFVSNAGVNNDIDVSMLTITGEGGVTYTLSSTADVDISSATQFSVTLSGMDIPNVEALLNKNGIQSAFSNTIYNLAAADNWMTGSPAANDISDLTGNGITVSNYADPVITSSTYDVSTGVLVATGTNFVVNSGATNDVDASLFTFTGQGGGGSSYTLTNTSDVEITSATQFTLTLSAADKLNVDGLLNRNGTQSLDLTTYNLAAADNWMTGSPSGNNIADATTPITVSNVPIPTITSATYNYNTNVVVVTGTGFIPNAGGANDVDISKLTITGEGGGTYPIASATDVEITSATEFSLTLSGVDLTNIEALLNKDGTSSAGNTIYNLAAAEDWLTGFDPAENIADLTNNGITVSNYANPAITSATYDASTGVLVVTGTNLVSKSGANNDIDASLLTITGDGNNTYQLTNTPDVDINSSTSFTLTLSTADKLNVDGLLNKAGLNSADNTAYNLAGADNWEAGAYTTYNVEDLSGNGINVSNILTPTITNATYDSDTGIFVVAGTNLFKKYGAANDIDVSKFTVTGEGGTYTITSATDVEITSSTEFTFTVTGSDKTQVDAKLDLFGTQSSGTITYNLAAAEDWLTAADPAVNIADLTNNGITVVISPKITSATYDAATGVIIVTGTNIQANGGGADIDAQKVTLTGEGGETYTLTDTPDIERTGATLFTLTLSATDRSAVNLIINKNGTSSTNGTTYNLAAADDWCTNVTAGNTADLTGNGITAGNVPVPTITSATYNASTGALVVTGTGLVKKSGVLNDIDISKFTVTGEGSNTYNIANTPFVEITSGTQFTVTLDAADKAAVNQIINKNGTTSTSGTVYNLAAAEDWASGADATVNVVDATGNGITANNVPVPVIVSASYHWSNGILTATGTGFTKKAGAANDIDASKFTFRGEGVGTYTLVGSPDVEITSSTQFSITLDATDKAAVNLLLNKPGTQSNDNTVYNLAAAEDWAAGADAAVNVVDVTTPITAGNFNNPPTGDDDVVSMPEDSPYTFAAGNFTYNDADADPFAGIKIETLETTGTLKYNGADVTIGLDCPDVTKLVFTSASNLSGSPYATFTFKVKDNRDAYSVATYTMTINVVPVNDPPVVVVNSGFAVAEGGNFTLSFANLLSEDIDSDVNKLVYSFNSGPLHGSILVGESLQVGVISTSFTQNNINNGEVIYVHDGSEAPADTIKFIVTDIEGGGSTESTFLITINGVNDPPELKQISDQTTEEDKPLTINLLATDKDNNKITFSASSNKTEVRTTVTGSILTIAADANWYGESEISVTASDGIAGNSKSFKLTITPVNDAPKISAINNIKIKEDEIIEIVINGSDVDGDSLTYTSRSSDGNVAVSMNGNKLTITPRKKWFGTIQITSNVSDGKLTTGITFPVEVQPVNNAPVLTNIESNDAEYIVKGSGLKITDSINIEDIDDGFLESASVSIVGNYQPGEDKIIFTQQGGINSLWESESGTLILSGSASLSDYELALRNVEYLNSNLTPTKLIREISITVNDGDSVSNAVSRKIIVTGKSTAPILSGIEADTIKFYKGETETIISSKIVVEDSDNKYLFEGKVSFKEGFLVGEDELLFDNQTSITGNYDPTSGVVTFTGQATVEEYQNALRTVKYSNTKGIKAKTSVKELIFEVWDGQWKSNRVSRNIEVVSPLLTPSNLTVEMNDNWNVILNWKDNSNNEDGFIIGKIEGSQNLTVLDSVNANTTEFIDEEVMEGRNYTYRVLAFNNLGAVSDTTNDNINSILIPLKPPTDLKAVVNPEGKIDLIWTDNSLVEEMYLLERSEVTDDNFKEIHCNEADSCNFCDRSIANKQKYYYRVSAVKDSIQSEYSNVIEVIGIVTDIDDELTGIPTEYKLYQNYPNPFNPSTVIKFDIPKEGKYVIRVYNILGEVVSVLADKEYSAGRYIVTFDASNLSSGIYFYQLIGNEKNFIKKMLLIK